MKTELWRRDPASYPFTTTLQLRGEDLDTERHINNVVVKALHAEVRQRWQLQAFPGQPAWFGPRRALRPLELVTHYATIAHYPADVQAGLRLLRADPHELVCASALFQHGQCLGVHEARLAVWEDDQPSTFQAAEWQALLPQVQPAPGPAPAVAARPIGGSERRQDYPLGEFVTLRYGDFDPHWCVSDICLMRCVEQVRSALVFRLMREAGVPYQRSGGGAVVMATKRVRVLGLSRATERLEARIGLLSLGGSSFDFAVALFDGDRCVALADGVTVYMDHDTQRPKAVPAALRAALQRLAG